MPDEKSLRGLLLLTGPSASLTDPVGEVSELSLGRPPLLLQPHFVLPKTDNFALQVLASPTLL